MKKSLIPLLLIVSSPLLFSEPPKEQTAQNTSYPISQTQLTMSSTNSSTNSITSSNNVLSVSEKPQLFTLPNGMTIIVEEDRSAPVVSVQAWCGTGSIHEGRLLGAGLSHILEHMLFKGTTTRAPGVIAKQVQDQGGYINAYTSFDRTVYWIDAPSTGTSEAVDILADAMMNATLPKEEYDKEQEVIHREFAMVYDNPDRMSSELLFRTAFHVSPFREPVIGHLDIYNTLTREDAMAYYKMRYVPNNICFVIVGDVDARKIVGQLTGLFETQPRQPLEPVLVQEEPPQLGKRVGRDVFPTELSRINIAWKAPGLTSPDAPAVEVLSSVLGSGASSLLNQEVCEKQELVYQISAGLYTLNQREGLIYLAAIADPKKRDAAEAEILRQVELLEKNGITTQQLEKAKKGILADHLNSLTTMRGRASDYGGSWLETGDPRFGKEYLAAINRVTSDDVKRVATKYLINDGLTVTSLDPEPAEKLDTTAEKKEDIVVAGDVKKFTLPNGLRLLVREDHRLPLVTMTAFFRGGLLIEDIKNNGITQLLASTITKGTTTKTAEQIAQTIEQVGGSIGADAGSNSLSVALDVMKPDLQLGMDLLSDVLTDSTFPQSEVDREKMTQLASIKAEDDQVTSVAKNLLKKKLFGKHPYSRRLVGTSESVAALTPEMLKTLYKHLVVGNNGVLAVFGDVKAEEVLAMATKAFSNIPTGTLALEDPPVPALLTEAISEQATQQKQQAIVMKGFLGAALVSPDRPELEILATACSDLGSRFFNRIREKLGLAYFVGASNSMGLAQGAFIFYLGTDPKKCDLAKHEFDDEINKLAKDGLTQEELDRAKKKILGSEAINNQSNAGMAAESAGDELMGLGFDHYQHRTSEINGVTLDKVNNVIKKYLAVPGSVEIVVTPNEAVTAKLHQP
ncbi:MAG: M16 family metallopeptidase [Chthoniobacterales bacterium]